MKKVRFFNKGMTAMGEWRENIDLVVVIMVVMVVVVVVVVWWNE